jgi:hypothetical protein
MIVGTMSFKICWQKANKGAVMKKYALAAVMLSLLMTGAIAQTTPPSAPGTTIAKSADDHNHGFPWGLLGLLGLAGLAGLKRDKARAHTASPGGATTYSRP